MSATTTVYVGNLDQRYTILKKVRYDRNVLIIELE